MYIAKTKTETITSNKILPAEDFGGWQAVNVGTTKVYVSGTLLDPNGAIVAVDFTHLNPDVIWGEPIKITFDGAGTNKLIITRIKYTKQ